MIIKYSDNLFLQIVGVIYHNGGRIIAFIIIAGLAALQQEFTELVQLEPFVMPAMPVSVLGGALAIFLAFRNNHAYDRWWEARKIWGGIVNSSRTIAMMILSFASTEYSKGNATAKEVETWKKEMIFRHLAWVNALVFHLRKQRHFELYSHYLATGDSDRVKNATNRPAQLINIQGQRFQDACEKGIIEDFRHMELVNMLKELTTLQGQSERIKNTVFPYYYNYFTRVFMWIFILVFPFVLVVECTWWVSVPLSVAISFVFSILEKSGTITEEPFEDRAADTPISAITRSIEIDLLEMLGEEDIPKPWASEIGKFDVSFMK